MKIELVTHCFRYPTLLRYQLSSLVLWPPPKGAHVTATVYFTHEYEVTARVLEWFGNVAAPQVSWNWQPLPPVALCRRSIGRNRAALATQADWVWFCDADYWFTTKCWEWFVTSAPDNELLIYPRVVQGHRSHLLGDACILRARETVGMVQADPAEFEPNRMKRAIGGIQIVQGDVCRVRGYLDDKSHAQTPFKRARWRRTYDDVWFRSEFGTSGTGVELPGVYRIRHSQAGRDMPGLQL